MPDIVKELLAETAGGGSWGIDGFKPSKLHKRAASEITRLRALLKRLEAKEESHEVTSEQG